MSKFTHSQRSVPPFSVDRHAAPDCEDLQLRIVAETQNLPQSISEHERSTVANFASALKKFLQKFFSVKPIALVGLAAVAAFSLNSILPMPTPGFVGSTGIVPSPEQVTTESQMDQLAWDDLLLLQDELAFAEL